MGKAGIFSEALPFIARFRGTTVVIKYGGSAMVDDLLRGTFADDVAMLHYVGIKPIIVHGGGPHISRAMGQKGIEPQWIEGLRVTDEHTMRVVQATLVGEINRTSSDLSTTMAQSPLVSQGWTPISLLLSQRTSASVS